MEVELEARSSSMAVACSAAACPLHSRAHTWTSTVLSAYTGRIFRFVSDTHVSLRMKTLLYTSISRPGRWRDTPNRSMDRSACDGKCVNTSAEVTPVCSRLCYSQPTCMRHGMRMPHPRCCGLSPVQTMHASASRAMRVHVGPCAGPARKSESSKAPKGPVLRSGSRRSQLFRAAPTERADAHCTSEDSCM